MVGHGAEGASQLGFASWAGVEPAEVGGKDILAVWNSNKSMRAERPGLSAVGDREGHTKPG